MNVHHIQFLTITIILAAGFYIGWLEIKNMKKRINFLQTKTNNQILPPAPSLKQQLPVKTNNSKTKQHIKMQILEKKTPVFANENINEVYKTFEQTHNVRSLEQNGDNNDSDYTDGEYTDATDSEEETVAVESQQNTIEELTENVVANAQDDVMASNIQEADVIKTQIVDVPSEIVENVQTNHKDNEEAHSDNTQKSVEEVLDQEEPFSELEQIYNNYIKDDLKKVLKKNSLAITGNKETLIRRIMENVPNYKTALNTLPKK